MNNLFNQLNQQSFAVQSPQSNNPIVNTFKKLKLMSNPMGYINSMPEMKNILNMVQQNAVQQGLEKWVKWETATFALYQNLYQELIKIGKVRDAIEFKHLICDVKEELETATQYHLNKLSTNFDMVYIIEEQNSMDKTI